MPYHERNWLVVAGAFFASIAIPKVANMCEHSHQFCTEQQQVRHGITVCTLHTSHVVCARADLSACLYWAGDVVLHMHAYVHMQICLHVCIRRAMLLMWCLRMHALCARDQVGVAAR